MEFDLSRVAELAGLSSSRCKASGVLSEARQISSIDTIDVDLDPVTEAKLRKAIRAELKAALREVMQERQAQEARALTHAQSTKSVTQALGFSGPRFVEKPEKNRSAVKGPGHSRAFGGPGFM